MDGLSRLHYSFEGSGLPCVLVVEIFHLAYDLGLL